MRSKTIKITPEQHRHLEVRSFWEQRTIGDLTDELFNKDIKRVNGDYQKFAPK